MTDDEDSGREGREEHGIGGSGYTLDELSAYLDRGESPAIAAIDDDAECQALLASMRRLGSLSRELVERDVAQAPEIDEGWLGSLMSTVAREVRAGRDIPYPSPDPLTRLTITEGAVRELIRAAGDAVPGVLVGRCALVGDVTDPEATVSVDLSISVVFTAPLQETTRLVREAVYSALVGRTPLRPGAIDIRVTDVHEPSGPSGEVGA